MNAVGHGDDPGVIAARLDEPDVGNLYVEAAGELGDPKLLPQLRHLEATGWRYGNDPERSASTHPSAAAPPTPPPD